eukprot:SAG31_NODE_12358_length_947_cov_2.073113_2_plen_78_part_00
MDVHLARVNEALSGQVDLQQIRQLGLRSSHIIERRSCQDRARGDAMRSSVAEAREARGGLKTTEVAHLSKETRLQSA